MTTTVSKINGVTEVYAKYEGDANYIKVFPTVETGVSNYTVERGTDLDHWAYLTANNPLSISIRYRAEVGHWDSDPVYFYQCYWDIPPHSSINHQRCTFIRGDVRYNDMINMGCEQGSGSTSRFGSGSFIVSGSSGVGGSLSNKSWLSKTHLFSRRRVA